MSPADDPTCTATTSEVGYCKPPKASQWRKGQSGNLAGKKSGAKNLKAVFNKVAFKKVPVTAPNGKKSKKTLLELSIAAIFQHAKNGNKAMMPIADLLLEHEFHEPSPDEKPPVLGKIMKAPEGIYKGVYIVNFMSNELKTAIENLAKAANMPASELAESDEAYAQDDETDDPEL